MGSGHPRVPYGAGHDNGFLNDALPDLKEKDSLVCSDLWIDLFRGLRAVNIRYADLTIDL